jgi:nucleotide-binding universal stress UspA family protein
MCRRRRLKEGLEGRARELEERLGRTPFVRAAVGDAADFIMEVAGEGEKPALVAVGRRGLGTIRSALLGSVSGRIASVASGPVLIAP